MRLTLFGSLLFLPEQDRALDSVADLSPAKRRAFFLAIRIWLRVTYTPHSLLRLAHWPFQRTSDMDPLASSHPSDPDIEQAHVGAAFGSDGEVADHANDCSRAYPLNR